MAICADSDIRITLSQKLTMLARPVNLKLVHSYVWIEAPHVLGVGMARGAELRDLGLLGSSLERLVLGQLHIVLEGIAAVTVLAA
jgi:hypothetical protein